VCSTELHILHVVTCTPDDINEIMSRSRFETLFSRNRTAALEENNLHECPQKRSISTESLEVELIGKPDPRLNRSLST
jgi:hypothetical protein